MAFSGLQNTPWSRYDFPYWPSGFSNSSVQFSCVWLFATPWTAAARPPCPSPTPGACSNSCPLSWWGHSTISPSVVPFSSCLHSFPALGSFPRSQFFESGGQSTGVSASASVLPVNIQDWFPLGLTGLISLQSKGLSRVFSNTVYSDTQLIKKLTFSFSYISLWYHRAMICEILFFFFKRRYDHCP